MNSLSTLNPQLSTEPVHGEEGIRRRKFGWRVLDFIIGGIFIYAGILKIIDPVEFARDIDNYKLLPWPAAAGLAFYLPWLEVLCGLALIFRRLYRGSLLILTGLTIVFIVASIIAKSRGLDITCGCFGHASAGWSFAKHMVLDFGLLIALVALWFGGSRPRQST